MSDPKCTATEAVLRALSVVNSRAGQYGYGTGDYAPAAHPAPIGTTDTPWTASRDAAHPGPSSDCAGFAICYCWKLTRHRPGFANGMTPPEYRDDVDIDDDINCNSAIEDARTKQELFQLVGAGEVPRPGDLLTYPTIQLRGQDGHWVLGDNGKPRQWIGHVAIVVAVPVDYKPGEGWHRLGLAQCHGPNGFKPGAVRTDGSGFDHHDAQWPKAAHRCVVLRPRQRT